MTDCQVIKNTSNLYVRLMCSSSRSPFSSISLLDEMHKQVKTACIRLKNESNSTGNAVKDRETVISSLILHSQKLFLSNGKQHFRLSYL